MNDHEKEKEYREAVSYITSSLTNDELYLASLDRLASLGDYKDAAELEKKYRLLFEQKQEDVTRRKRGRRVTVTLQWLFTGIGALLALTILFLILYGILH